MTTKTSAAVTLTSLETAVLRALYDSASGNGHDFGMTEDARSAVKSKRQLAGAIASLVKKGLIEVAEPHNVNGEGNWVTQFTWAGSPGECPETVKALLGIETKKAEAAPVATPAPKVSETTTKKITITDHQAQALREALAQAPVAGVKLEGRVLFVSGLPETKKARKALLGGVLSILEKGFQDKRDSLVASLETQLEGKNPHWMASLHVNNLVRSAKAVASIIRARLAI